MSETKIIHRECSECGTDLTIEVEADDSYSGGYYFGCQPARTEDGDHVLIEVWECTECYESVRVGDSIESDEAETIADDTE